MQIDPYIAAFHCARIGYPVNRNYADFLIAFRANPDLVAEAKAEVARLSTPERYGRNLSLPDQGCHESKIRHDRLVEMLAEFENA